MLSIDKGEKMSKHGNKPEESGHAEHAKSEHTKGKKTDFVFIAQVGIIAVLFLFLMFSFVKLNSLKEGSAASAPASTANAGGSANSAVNLGSVPASEILPTGEPGIYGKELGIKYDDVSAANAAKTEATINVLAGLDNSITLSGADLERYIRVAGSISCEYCCGAPAIIFSNGQPACGCAHSYAMRGLAKYLIKNHPTEFTDEQILEELGKWKVLFFPGVHMTKAAVLKSNGIELNYVNLASNKYRGIEKGQQAGGGMVGGC